MTHTWLAIADVHHLFSTSIFQMPVFYFPLLLLLLLLLKQHVVLLLFVYGANRELFLVNCPFSFHSWLCKIIA